MKVLVACEFSGVARFRARLDFRPFYFGHRLVLGHWHYVEYERAVLT